MQSPLASGTHHPRMDGIPTVNNPCMGGGVGGGATALGGWSQKEPSNPPAARKDRTIPGHSEDWRFGLYLLMTNRMLLLA